MAAQARMTFDRFGRSYHLRIATAEDLRAVMELDEAHWVASAAPIESINCDLTFLQLVDSDHNGRILCYELKDAIAWLLANLRDTSGMGSAGSTLRLAAVNADQPDGARVIAAASKMLSRLGAEEAEQITLEQVRKIKAHVEATPVSEGGVVLPEAAAEPAVRQFIEDVIATEGGEPHPSGAAGLTQAKLDQFLSDARAYLQWRARGDLPAGQNKTEIMVLGSDTPAAFAVLASLREKLEQYFAQCEAVALDADMARQIGPRPAELEALDFGDPAAIEQLLKDAPLAEPRADRFLAFADRINPHYAESLSELRAKVIQPVLGGPEATLSQQQWGRVKGAFAAHEAWLQAKAGSAVEPLGGKKLTGYLDQRFSSAVTALLAESTATAIVLDNIRLTEKLILYQAYLCELANNFVSFRDLYSTTRRAMPEMGTLIMDGRRFNLSVRAANRPEHAAVARNSNMFVLYCQISPKSGGAPYEVALPVTAGGKGNLCVGKRGIFQDIHGNECDARVVQIIENPISLVEALVAPFQRLGRVITGKIESLTAEAEKKLDAQAAAVAEVKGPRPAAQPAGRPSGLMAGGLLMGGGVAVAAIGSAVAYFTKTIAGLQWWKVLIGVASAVLAVLLPTSIVALVKLRRRDLSGILEGSGWAVNARMRLNRRLARFFTRRPAYPEGAKGVRRMGRWTLLAMVVVIALLATGGYFALKHRAAGRAAATQPAPAGLAPGPGAK